MIKKTIVLTCAIFGFTKASEEQRDPIALSINTGLYAKAFTVVHIPGKLQRLQEGLDKKLFDSISTVNDINVAFQIAQAQQPQYAKFIAFVLETNRKLDELLTENGDGQFLSTHKDHFTQGIDKLQTFLTAAQATTANDPA